MRPEELILPLACAVSGAAWTTLAAWKADVPGRFAVRALLAGVGAFGVAIVGYELAAISGLLVEWELLVHGELGTAALLAAVIGLVEEGAKLVGVLLVVERGWRGRAVVGTAIAVAAGFGAVETFVTMQGAGPGIALARAALGPAAHALLALPLAVGVAAAAQRGASAWPLVALGLGASAALHAAGDLSLAVPGAGRLGYALALLAPALWMYARSRAALRRTVDGLAPVRAAR
jgi:RsiW-degrading membrane proteinase PrsW (M82 family)